MAVANFLIMVLIVLTKIFKGFENSIQYTYASMLLTLTLVQHNCCEALQHICWTWEMRRPMTLHHRPRSNEGCRFELLTWIVVAITVYIRVFIFDSAKKRDSQNRKFFIQKAEIRLELRIALMSSWSCHVSIACLLLTMQWLTLACLSSVYENEFVKSLLIYLLIHIFLTVCGKNGAIWNENAAQLIFWELRNSQIQVKYYYCSLNIILGQPERARWRWPSFLQILHKHHRWSCHEQEYHDSCSHLLTGQRRSSSCLDGQRDIVWGLKGETIETNPHVLAIVLSIHGALVCYVCVWMLPDDDKKRVLAVRMVFFKAPWAQ